jgi:hypothetical protein
MQQFPFGQSQALLPFAMMNVESVRQPQVFNSAFGINQQLGDALARKRIEMANLHEQYDCAEKNLRNLTLLIATTHCRVARDEIDSAEEKLRKIRTEMTDKQMELDIIEGDFRSFNSPLNIMH